MKKAIIILLMVLISIPVVTDTQAYEYKGIDIYGFISQGYLKSTDNNFFAQTEDGTSQFNEMGINFATDVTDRLRLGVQFLARDLGTIGNNEVILDWAIADYRWRDYLGLLVGDIKFSVGLYNETRDIDMLRTNIFLPQSVYNEGWRENFTSIQGAGIYGDVPLDKAGSLTYVAQYGTVNIAANKGSARLLEDQWPFRTVKPNKDVEYYVDLLSLDVTEIDDKYIYAVNLKWNTQLEGLIIGTSTWGYEFKADADTKASTAAMSTDPTLAALAGSLAQYGVELSVYPSEFTVNTSNYTGSVEYTWRNLVLAAEYSRTTYEISLKNPLLYKIALLRTNLPGVQEDGTYDVDKFSSVGYYGSAAYRFTPWFELGTYYSVYYPDEDDKSGEDRITEKKLDRQESRGWLKDLCLTFRFDIKETWILKLEGHKMDGNAILLGTDNPAPATNPTTGVYLEDRYKPDWYLFGAKLTYNF